MVSMYVGWRLRLLWVRGTVLSVDVCVFVPRTSDGVLLVYSVVYFVSHCVTFSVEASSWFVDGMRGKLCVVCVCFGCVRLFSVSTSVFCSVY